MSADPEAVAARLEEATERAREVLAETRGVTKDLLAAIKTARGLFTELGESALNAEVNRQLEGLAKWVHQNRRQFMEALTADLRELVIQTAQARMAYTKERQSVTRLSPEQVIALAEELDEVKGRR